ncbi:U24-ctenitoxin-Pn1a-like [Centruroides sculpturatus]|uniref:U24-ctenitoxin-Pn1a-like n=1 Tax=Centruroides sculpturatus TaxID=218467 RepID=UPI000C6D05AB|nr:U24-ctenitoxin-Pn1a-like [Centruroides sculpturatus]
MNFKLVVAICCFSLARARKIDAWPEGEYVDDDVDAVVEDDRDKFQITDKDGGPLDKIRATGFLLNEMKFNNMKIFVIAVRSPPKGLVRTETNAVTDCLRRREEALKNPFPRLIPECDADGNYNQRQCLYGDKERCQCWSRDGRPLSHSFANVVDCKCHTERDKARQKGLIGTFAPQCNEDGTYKPKQCWASPGLCWCVAADGRQISPPTREDVRCSYL